AVEADFGRPDVRGSLNPAIVLVFLSFADAVAVEHSGNLTEPRGSHRNTLTRSSTAALSASSRAISSRMSVGLRNASAWGALGLRTVRSKFAGSRLSAAMRQLFGPSANSACFATKSAMSASFNGLV